MLSPLTDRPAERFAPGASFLTDEDPPRRLEIETSSEHTDGVLVSFREVGDRTQAEALRGVSLTIELGQRRELGGDEYWPEQLIGCAVVDSDGRSLGQVVALAPSTAQDRLVVESSTGERTEVPFVAELVPRVDVDRRLITMDPPRGLFR